MINLSYLRYFYICAQSGTFTKAASRLGISQPSLSMQIKSFEEQLGFHLFIRTGRSIQLTSKGQGLFLYASKVFEVTDELEKFLRKNEPAKETSLKIGVSDEVERPFVAEVVGRLIKAKSTHKLIPSIISKGHNQLVSMTSDEEIDVIISNSKAPELKLVCTLDIPVMLISTNSVSQTTKSAPVNLHNLLKMLDQNLILPTNEMILAKEANIFLKQKNIVVPTVLTSNIIACIVRAVQEKLGASFLPISYVQREIKIGSLQAYGPPEGYWQHHLYLYTYKGNTNAFVACLSKVMQDFSALKFATHTYEVKN